MNIDLKAYVSRARELEAAIYTQKQLMAEHKKIMDNASPTVPTKRTVSRPIEPVRNVCQSNSSNAKPWIFSILLTGVGILYVFILFSSVEMDAFTMILGLGLGVFGVIWLYSLISKKKEDEKIQKDNTLQYSEAMEEYQRKLNEYSVEAQKATDEYMAVMQKYNADLQHYNNTVSNTMKHHDELLRSLVDALDKHYSQNVIFAKYRNLIAISTIEEYLLSGRCDKLEGAEGAYNLYEMELRQNIVIGQLSNILSNLEQIRNNQYSLYQELMKANATVNGILREVRGINQSAKLTAYFTGVTALIEASPKVYISHTF